MKAIPIVSILLAAAAGAWTTSAAAIEPIPQEAGWSGFAVLGVGRTEIKSNLLAGNSLVEIGRDTIGTVGDAPRSDSSVHPLVTGEINYTTPGRWQFFLGTSLEDAITLDGAAQVGVRKDVGDAGTVQAGLLFNGVTTKVWSDPYAEGVARHETNRDSSGARVQWDRVLGSAFQLTFSYRDISIDDEQSGRGVRTVACNAACRDLLRRDGDRYSFDVSYLYRIGDGQPRHLLRPQLNYTVDDRDGAAISSKSWRLQLSHVYLGLASQGYTFASNVVYGSTTFDESNPIFGRKTNSDRIALDTMMFYRLTGNWQLLGSVTWGKDDSDVRFHDNELFSFGVGAMYRFGN